MAIDGLKFSWFCREQIYFDPCVTTAVEQKSIYRSTSVQLPCQIKFSWLHCCSVYCDSGGVSLLQVHNNAAGGFPRSPRWCGWGICSVLFIQLTELKKLKEDGTVYDQLKRYGRIISIYSTSAWMGDINHALYMQICIRAKDSFLCRMAYYTPALSKAFAYLLYSGLSKAN